jgi:hypothetical protein
MNEIKGEYQMENQTAYQSAEKRAEAKLRFYIQLAVYIAVNTLLIVINVRTSPQYLWFIWPLMGWGIGVLVSALRVFVFSGKSSVQV